MLFMSTIRARRAVSSGVYCGDVVAGGGAGGAPPFASDRCGCGAVRARPSRISATFFSATWSAAA